MADRASFHAEATNPLDANAVSAFSEAAGSRRHINRSTLTLAVLFAVAFIWLAVSSRQIGKYEPNSAEKTQQALVRAGLLSMETLAAGTDKLSEESQPMLRAILAAPSSRHLQAQPGKDPHLFSLAALRPPEPTTEPAVEPVATETQPARPSAPPVDALKLQSILRGPVSSTAMISDRLVREGQVISGWTVSRIEDRAVVLTWRDQKHVLKLP